MNARIRSLTVVLTVGLLLSLMGCESHRETNPIFPEESALLILSFAPNPVIEGADGRFDFIVTVEEINGVGARITSVKLENLDEDGDVVDTDRHDEAWVQRTFGTSAIEAFGRLAARIELEAYNSERENWILRGTDDLGNSFEFSQSVELIGR